MNSESALECEHRAGALEFGSTGTYWNNVGWKVTVRFQRLQSQIRPADHMTLLRPLLPERYSPLQATGRGNQAYLMELSRELFGALTTLIGSEADVVRQLASTVPVEDRQIVAGEIARWEHHLENEIERNASIPSTDREAVVMARRGQGLFR